jgi:peptide/nickel transport system permease protein
MLLIIFALKLGVLPTHGWGGFFDTRIIMPALVLGIPGVAIVARLTRASALDVVNQDYIRTARAKGLQERLVVYRHAFKNASIPVLTMAGLQLSSLVLGAVVVEPIFAWPGLGWLIVNAVGVFDYPVVLGSVISAVIIVTVVNLAVDILYGWLDPRIRLS